MACFLLIRLLPIAATRRDLPNDGHAIPDSAFQICDVNHQATLGSSASRFERTGA
jgi:hypothetical protein